MKVIGYPLTNMGTNCYLAFDEDTGDAVLFDPAGYSKQFTKYIRDNNLKLHFIVLTHGHGDHIGGVKEFMQEFPETKLLAGEKELPMLKDSNMNFSGAINGVEVELNPDVLVNDGDVVNAGSLELKILETPGHTEGGLSILIDDALFCGDTIFRESIGRTDLQGGDYATLISSIKNKLYTLPDETKVYPGHMGTTSIGHEKKRNPFVKG